MTVQTDGATKVYRSGKNILKHAIHETAKNGVTFVGREDGTILVNGTATATVLYQITYKFPIKAGVTYTLSGCEGGSNKKYRLYGSESGIISLYNTSEPATAVAESDGVINVNFQVFQGATVTDLVIKPQLEIGSVATPYEQHRETEEFAPNEAIPSLDGVNTIWADSGDVTVTGRADPVAIIDKLTNAIVALGGTV